MYKRLRDGLFSPSSIVDYMRDKMYRPFLQLLIYAILMTIPFIITQFTIKGLDYSEKQAIAESFRTENVPFKIEDGKLINVNGDEDFVFKKKLTNIFSIKIGKEESSLDYTYIIYLSEEGFNVKFAYFSIYQGKYSDYDELKNIDLEKLNNPNCAEWDQIFSVVDNYIRDFYRSNIVSTIFMSIIRYMIFLLILTLFISASFAFRFFGLLKYSAMFKLSAYYTAPFVLGMVLSNLFSVSIFYILGLFISVIYTFMGSTTIIKRLLNSDRK